MRLRGDRLAFALLLAIAALVPSGAEPQAGGYIPIAEQQRILETAMAETLAGLPPEVAARARALCVGSWCADVGHGLRPGAKPNAAAGAGPLSDLDLTIDHPDRSVARAIAEDVNRRVEAHVSRGSLKHKIKAVYADDPNFAEFFTGDTGQAYVREYAWRNAPGGRATFVPKVQDGRVRFDMADASEFWKGVGKPVPRRFSSLNAFVADSARLFGSARTGDVLTDALSAAKYMNNVESIVKPGFSAHYGVPMPASLQLDELTKYRVREMMAIKADTAAMADPLAASIERAQRLKTLFGAADDLQLRTRLAEFVDGTGTYFATTGERVALFEGLVRSGALHKAANPSAVLDVAGRLAATLKAHAGAAAIDIVLLAHHYSVHGADQAFVEQLAQSGAMWGMPQAAITAMVGAVAKELGRAAGEFAVNAAVFDAINDAMIVSSYTPANAWYLFSSDLGGNPFAGYSRATLACKYMGNRTARGDPLLSELEPHVAVDIDGYVDALSAFRGLSGFTYGDLGPADIRGRLLPYVMGDLRQSRQMWQSLGARETHLYATRVVAFPVRPALTVWVNNAAIPERTRQAFALDVAPGQEVTFFVDVRREFARTVTHNPPPPGAMQAKWCEVQGDWARYLKWETSVLDRQEAHETSPTPVRVGATLRGADGWRVSTTLPVKIGGGAATAETTIAGNSRYGQLSDASGTLRVTLAPTAQAKGPASVELGFGLKDQPLGLDEHYTVTLTARPTGMATPAPTTGETPWAEILERAIARVQKELAGAAPRPAAPASIALDQCLQPELGQLERSQRLRQAITPQSPMLFSCWRSAFSTLVGGQDWGPKACCDDLDAALAAARSDAARGAAWFRLQTCSLDAQIAQRLEALNKKRAQCATPPR